MNGSIIGAAVVLLQGGQQPTMTAGGWVFMAAAWLVILVLVFYSFSKILSNK